jgi:hypothetical protein
MDLAGHYGRHEERERGCREQKVDPAAAYKKRGTDRAHDDEDSEHVPRVLARCQGGNDTEDAAGGEYEHGLPSRHPANPPRGTAGPEAVKTDLVAHHTAAARCALFGGQAGPPGEIIR